MTDLWVGKLQKNWRFVCYCAVWDYNTHSIKTTADYFRMLLLSMWELKKKKDFWYLISGEIETRKSHEVAFLVWTQFLSQIKKKVHTAVFVRSFAFTAKLEAVGIWDQAVCSIFIIWLFILPSKGTIWSCSHSPGGASYTSSLMHI